MTLVMTLLARNEADILHQNITYHLESGVDHVIVTDNLSQDQTADIIHDFARQGVATYLREQSDTHAQGKWVTRMARQAKAQFGASWVINNDADEFWIPSGGGSLRAYFKGLWRFNLVKAPRHDFVCQTGDQGPFWQRMLHRKTTSLNALGRPLPMKVAHRGLATVEVGDGNHAVKGFRWPRTCHQGLEILHFPLRSRQQYYDKIRVGAAALARNTDLSQTTGATWRRQHEELQQTGTLRYVDENELSEAQVRHLLQEGTLVRDTRLRDILAPLYR
jgi:hypothetical protein